MRKVRAVLLIAILSMVTVAAVAAPALAHNNRIRINKFFYVQNLRPIHPGAEVKVENIDGQVRGIPHSLTSSAGLFDTGVFTTGERIIVAPSTPGVYRYFCQVHNFMKGQLTVSTDPGAKPSG